MKRIFLTILLVAICLSAFVGCSNKQQFATIIKCKINYASLEKQTSGDFAGAYKYTNTSLGKLADNTGVSGEAGIYFNEIFPISGGRSEAFHDEGYQYVTLEFYATESVYSISFVENWMSAGAARVFTLTAGQTLPENDIFAN